MYLLVKPNEVMYLRRSYNCDRLFYWRSIYFTPMHSIRTQLERYLRVIEQNKKLILEMPDFNIEDYLSVVCLTDLCYLYKLQESGHLLSVSSGELHQHTITELVKLQLDYT